ncbi:hypothetical protein Poly51_01400 [Rubripirellula tenax]|uniref:Uncharacterized protein n=1 Tax=Rubripirellula tenax TaxID=2528015 RepID=A0A5C6FID7_9BACT|nr:hypothetical protein [Rubripirellula tenax]TWU59867.1 hypothetical protein Poly51_01400 [Rubripirellula tenax]
MSFTRYSDRNGLKIASVGMAMVLTVGCGSDSETLESIREAVGQVSRVSNPASGNSADQPGDPGNDVVLSNFTPPYPDREDAFSYPGEGTTSSEQSESAAVNSVAEIEVLGFANVGQAKVFLRSKSITRSLAVGDRFDGVEVVNIEPPRVEMKMGSLIWTATMFDKAR